MKSGKAKTMKNIRVDIIVHRADGKWAKVHVNWDDLDPHNGIVLFEEYTTQAKAEALVALGHLYSLGPEIGQKVDFVYKGQRSDEKGQLTEGCFQHMVTQKRQCVAYGRDGGLTPVTVVGSTLLEVWPLAREQAAFVYFWDDPDGSGARWYVGDSEAEPEVALELGAALMLVEKNKYDSTNAVKNKT